MERAAHDRIPLGRACVDTDLRGANLSLELADQSVEEILVGGRRSAPVLAAFDVKPDRTVVNIVVLQAGDHLLNLGGCAG